MKIIGVIPSRYASTRFPGKGLVDICGKPMLFWVYSTVKNVKGINEVVCAIDDVRSKEVCEQYGMKYVMTSSDCPEHISRIWEVSEKIKADYYMCINGDEPLISENCITPVIPQESVAEPYFNGAMRKLTDPVETVDSANIKLAVSDTGRCLYMSRTPVPYPKGTLLFEYNKYVGVECFNKAALDFFVNVPMGKLEKIEDIDHLRFLENGINLHFNYVESESISVDTKKDLEKVRMIMKERIEKGVIKLEE